MIKKEIEDFIERYIYKKVFFDNKKCVTEEDIWDALSPRIKVLDRSKRLFYETIKSLVKKKSIRTFSIGYVPKKK